MTNPFLLIALSLSLPFPVSSSTFNTLSQGSSLSVEKLEDVLISSSGVFSAGFYLVGENAYVFATWFSKPFCSDNCTIVWMANRDFPVNGKHSKLLLQKTGNLILIDAGKFTAWSTDTTSISRTKLYLYDNGNLVLRNLENVSLWQSFDSPTDTLLPGQELTKETQLVSSRSPTNFSSGFYKLFFDNDNLLSLLYDGPDVSSTYWPDPWLLSWQVGRFPYNSSRIASFDSLGNFTSSDNFTIQPVDYGVIIQRRLTLDCDGNLRLYSREDGSRNWTVSWQAFSQPCRIHGICGSNSNCIYDPIYGRKCSCIPGYRMINNTDWSYGCEPEFINACGTNDTEFVRLPHTEFYGFDRDFRTNYTLEMCKELCLASCYCKGLQYKFDSGNGISNCYPKILFMNGHHEPNFQGDIYVKVPKSSSHFSHKDMETRSRLVCLGGVLRVPLDRAYPKTHVNGIVKFMLLFACALGAVELIGIFFVWLILIIRSRGDSYQYKQVYHHAQTGFRRFTYSELAKATRNFSEEIGRGAGGTVYKGKLSDDRVAAIKRLFVANQGEAHFLAEISTIGRLNHMNLIDMWGYCAEGKHRLLVYEYMEHGSLAENLSSKSLDSRKRFQIALGTARGLAYLHEECLEWVLHCDVKPQNILLDANYQPKVSDFGLSKLLNRGGLNNSSFSKIRGTRGYVAPEWVFNFPITSKVDVYSYGIVVLEMVTGRSPVIATAKKDNGGNLEAGHGNLVSWVRDKRTEVGGGGEIFSSWISEIVDPKLEGKYDKAKMELLVNLALQCANEDRDARPSMSRVLEMLLQCENDS